MDTNKLQNDISKLKNHDGFNHHKFSLQFMIWAYLLWFFVWLVERFSKYYGNWLTLVALIVLLCLNLMVYTVTILIPPDLFNEEKTKHTDSDSELLIEWEKIYKKPNGYICCMIFSLLFMTLIFSQFSRNIQVLFPGSYNCESLDFWYWNRFGMANITEGLLFDIPQIYNWKISNIEPLTFWTSTFTLVFRIISNSLFIASTYRIFKHLKWKPLHYKNLLNLLLNYVKTTLFLIIGSIPLTNMVVLLIKFEGNENLYSVLRHNICKTVFIIISIIGIIDLLRFWIFRSANSEFTIQKDGNE